MKLESLPNELLLNLFDFLIISDILPAFRGLNSRFDDLLVRYFREHGFDLRSISRHNFDLVCQQYLSPMANQITSICLSDESATPEQIDRFYSHSFNLTQFTHLQLLTLCNVRFEQMQNKILLALPHLGNLTRLTLNHCNLADCKENGLTLINTIWSLPKLSHCYFNESSIFIHDEGRFVPPTVTSFSIKHISILSIDDYNCRMADIFKHTPNLQCLFVSVWAHGPNFILSSSVLSITALVLSGCPFSRLVDFLKWLPHLYRLKMTIDTYINGQHLGEFICSYLPNLKIFQFIMELFFHREIIDEKQIEQMLNTFRSPFWLDEHRWFVQCDYDQDYRRVRFYTLPDVFSQLPSTNNIQSKSTDPYKTSQLQSGNVKKLSIYLPMNDNIWLATLKLHRLVSLKVSSYPPNEHCATELQSLLDRACCLSSLCLRWPSVESLESIVFESRSTSVNRLRLTSYNQWFNNEQCQKLSRAPLGIRCEVLDVGVENRACVLDLINNMTNLRALAVQCRDDNWTESLTSTEDELIHWFQEHLPSTCEIAKTSRWNKAIRFWIQ